MNQTAFTKACLQQVVPELKGLTITGGAVDETGEYWGFVAEGKHGRKPIRKIVFVLCDPEGNGPGFLDIQKEEAT